MTRATALLIALSLLGCKTASTPPVAFPDLPPLPPSVMEECPPAERLSDWSLGNLVLADIDLALAYAKCKTRHRAAVEAYEKARQLVREAATKASRPQ